MNSENNELNNNEQLNLPTKNQTKGDKLENLCFYKQSIEYSYMFLPLDIFQLFDLGESLPSLRELIAMNPANIDHSFPTSGSMYHVGNNQLLFHGNIAPVSYYLPTMIARPLSANEVQFRTKLQSYIDQDNARSIARNQWRNDIMLLSAAYQNRSLEKRYTTYHIFPVLCYEHLPGYQVQNPLPFNYIGLRQFLMDLSSDPQAFNNSSCFVIDHIDPMIDQGRLQPVVEMNNLIYPGKACVFVCVDAGYQDTPNTNIPAPVGPILVTRTDCFRFFKYFTEYDVQYYLTTYPIDLFSGAGATVKCNVSRYDFYNHLLDVVAYDQMTGVQGVQFITNSDMEWLLESRYIFQTLIYQRMYDYSQIDYISNYQPEQFAIRRLYNHTVQAPLQANLNQLRLTRWIPYEFLNILYSIKPLAKFYSWDEALYHPNNFGLNFFMLLKSEDSRIYLPMSVVVEMPAAANGQIMLIDGTPIDHIGPINPAAGKVTFWSAYTFIDRQGGEYGFAPMIIHNHRQFALGQGDIELIRTRHYHISSWNNIVGAVDANNMLITPQISKTATTELSSMKFLVE